MLFLVMSTLSFKCPYYLCPYLILIVMSLMVRLQVNFFVDVCDYDNVKAHMIISFKMDDLDIVDVLSSQLVVPLAS